MPAHPKDRFDDLPRDLQRVGAHRAPKRRGRFWIGFAWAALATGVLVVGGLFVADRFLGIDTGIALFQPPATPTPAPEPSAPPTVLSDPTQIDPALGLQITVLNASGTEDAQTTVGDQLAAGGWPIGSRVNGSQADPTTIVFYSDAALEPIALGLVQALGLGTVQLVDAATFPGQPIVVAVGDDYFGAPADGGTPSG